MSDAPNMMAVDGDYQDIRDAVTKLCDDFPSTYWQGLEGQPPESSYPTEFINALTQAGWLGALIPEEYGGSGLPLRAAAVIRESIHATACSASAAHAQMYTMGTVLRHGSPDQKQNYLPKIASGELRLQAFGVTEPNTGSDTTQLRTRADKIDGGDGTDTATFNVSSAIGTLSGAGLTNVENATILFGTATGGAYSGGGSVNTLAVTATANSTTVTITNSIISNTAKNIFIIFSTLLIL